MYTLMFENVKHKMWHSIVFHEGFYSELSMGAIFARRKNVKKTHFEWRFFPVLTSGLDFAI